ncbi:MAG TPA: hypothetical protein VNE41_04265 [Chitinophagaceae bacterium]|nr:hypothetical protein [Chitinophagaceae bacterium]
MYNPLILLGSNLLEAFIRCGHEHFVRQSYPRGKNPGDKEIKAAFLISHYAEFHKALAHYRAMEGDRWRYLYNVQNAYDREKLFTAAGQPSGYQVYANILEKDWVPSREMGERIRKYLDINLGWNLSRYDEVRVKLFSEFGQLFLTLTCPHSEAKVPLADVEGP